VQTRKGHQNAKKKGKGWVEENVVQRKQKKKKIIVQRRIRSPKTLIRGKAQ